jgi:hypothetical protein
MLEEVGYDIVEVASDNAALEVLEGGRRVDIGRFFDVQRRDHGLAHVGHRAVAHNPRPAAGVAGPADVRLHGAEAEPLVGERRPAAVEEAVHAGAAVGGAGAPAGGGAEGGGWNWGAAGGGGVAQLAYRRPTASRSRTISAMTEIAISHGDLLPMGSPMGACIRWMSWSETPDAVRRAIRSGARRRLPRTPT